MGTTDQPFSLRLRIDPASVHRLNKTLDWLCQEVAQGLPALQEAFNRFVVVTDFPDALIELEADFSPAREITIALKPTRDFRQVIAAVAIGDVDYLVTATNRQVNGGQLQGQSS